MTSRPRADVRLGALALCAVMASVSAMAAGCTAGRSPAVDPQDAEVARACEGFATLVTDVAAKGKPAVNRQLADVRTRATAIVSREIAARSSHKPPPKWAALAEHILMGANFIAAGQPSSSETVLGQCDAVPAPALRVAGYKPHS